MAWGGELPAGIQRCRQSITSTIHVHLPVTAVAPNLVPYRSLSLSPFLFLVTLTQQKIHLVHRFNPYKKRCNKRKRPNLINPWAPPCARPGSTWHRSGHRPPPSCDARSRDTLARSRPRTGAVIRGSWYPLDRAVICSFGIPYPATNSMPFS